MAKKQIVFHAYIDNGKIRIISSDGKDIEKEIIILNIEIKKSILKYKAVGFFALIFTALLMSQVFGTKFSTDQNIIFGFSSMGLFFFCLITWEKLTNMTKKLELLNSNMNLAKMQLQNEILELERKLIDLNVSLGDVALKNKFNFSKNFKKQEDQKEI